MSLLVTVWGGTASAHRDGLPHGKKVFGKFVELKVFNRAGKTGILVIRNDQYRNFDRIRIKPVVNGQELPESEPLVVTKAGTFYNEVELGVKARGVIAGSVLFETLPMEGSFAVQHRRPVQQRLWDLVLDRFRRDVPPGGDKNVNQEFHDHTRAKLEGKTLLVRHDAYLDFSKLTGSIEYVDKDKQPHRQPLERDLKLNQKNGIRLDLEAEPKRFVTINWNLDGSHMEVPFKVQSPSTLAEHLGRGLRAALSHIEGLFAAFSHRGAGESEDFE